MKGPMMTQVKNDDQVRFIKTGDTRLNGTTGVVVGTYVHDHHAHYPDTKIVLFDHIPEGYTDKAIVITEACLELI
jgi:hypothetical protein